MNTPEPMNTTEHMNAAAYATFLIGEVARRTGLSVSAIRYYSDEGIVSPSGVTDGGHRLYDVEAIARLELLRTLRDLDAGLDQVRRVLAGTTTLRDHLVEHLGLIETRTAELQTKRAVLRALVRDGDPVGRSELLRKLVTMPDVERQQLIDDFWGEVAGDLSEETVEQIRGARPVLPADPTAEQLDAWITLAELLRDDQFRSATRAYLHETFATGPGAQIAEPPVQEFIDSAGTSLMSRLLAAHGSRLEADDPTVVALAAQLAEQTAGATGATANDALREQMADGFDTLDAVVTAAFEDPDYVATQSRYLELVALVNDEPHPDAALAGAVGEPSSSDDPALQAVGPWLAAALRASRVTVA